MYYGKQLRIQTVAYIVSALLILASFLLLISMLSTLRAQTDRNYATGRSNNTYLRTMVCISSVSPTKRTPDYVKSCYNSAEQSNHVLIEHYGDGK